ncbi:MAG: 50S ribosomal protein L9 [Acidimicrobiales bacterium]
MRVLLRADVAGVGRRGDLVSVADGFARNFLFPASMALKATDGIEGQANAMRRAADMRRAVSDQAARAQAEVLDGAVVSIEARASTAGRLFGSVGVPEIVDAIAQQKGVEVDRESIALIEPIKTLGTTEVVLTLFEDVSASVVVEVNAAG